jgi:peptidoglycan/xylan/chitin deacetylase (PgdA/CDA1 family)
MGPMKPKWMLFVGIMLLLAGCGRPADPAASETPPSSVTASPRHTVTRAPTSTPDPTPSVTPTETLVPTSTVIPSPTWAVTGPGTVIAPILLYHHIDPENTNPLYNVPPDKFIEQMQALDDWGYTTITISQLTAAIIEGAPLPPRPIVITFDDGQMSVFEHAFPIMQQHGFIGVNYIVANRIRADGFLTAEELGILAEAGWEVGSHSYTHTDLTLDHSIAFNEIYYSREDLQTALSVPVNSFAYPYGSMDDYLYDRTGKWGYTAAVGLGKQYTHNQFSLFYLARIEIKQAFSMEYFASLLPWSSAP